MKWIKYEVHTTTKDADSIGEVLVECGIGGYEITDHVPLSKKEERAMYTDIPKDMGVDDGTSVLTFYTEAPENEETDREFYSTGSSLRDENEWEQPVLPAGEWIRKIMGVLEERKELLDIMLPEITYTVEDDSLWKDKWKENFKPFRAAEDIIIKPSWEEAPADASENDIIIEIDPGSAFGSGTHETTKLCLLSMRKYITPETELLDAGCGSGILAITSARLGAKSVLALDIDPLAVSGTLENAEKNGISGKKLKAVHANILENAEQIQKEYPGKFHVVVANILADVIIALTPKVKGLLREDGVFISSGILSGRSGDVEQALEQNGFSVLEKNEMGEWCSFVAKMDEA